MKNYKLSEENKKIEIKHKKDIENNTIRRDRIYDRIKRIKLDSKLTHDEKRYQILNAEIELKELIMQIDKSNNRLSELYAKQAQSNINKKEPDSTTQRTKDDLRSYIDLNNYMNEKDMLYSDIEILEKKISLEYLKKNRGEIDEEIFKKNIEELKDKINNNQKTIDYYEMDIKEANYKRKWFDIKNDFDEGKITHKEYQEFKKTLDETEFENDFDKCFIEMLIGEFGSNGINESDLNYAKRVFNESRENLEKGKEQEKIEVEKTERGIW